MVKLFRSVVELDHESSFKLTSVKNSCCTIRRVQNALTTDRNTIRVSVLSSLETDDNMMRLMFRIIFSQDRQITCKYWGVKITPALGK